MTGFYLLSNLISLQILSSVTEPFPTAVPARSKPVQSAPSKQNAFQRYHTTLQERSMCSCGQPRVRRTLLYTSLHSAELN